MRTRIVFVIAAMFLAAPLAAQAPAPALGADVVRPGDLVRLRIWQEPDLSGEFPVNEGGEVVVPKLGPVRAAGSTRQELRERLVAGYSEFLTHNSVDVTVLRRIQVLGAVRTPGLYPVDGTMTIADVLALAGGAAPEARPDHVQLLRGGVRVDVRLSGADRVGDTTVRSGDQLFVPQRGWADRNTGTVAGALSAAAGLILTVFR